MKFLSNLIGLKSITTMNVMSCERVYCSGTGTYDTLYEVFPSGFKQKRGCCH